MDEWMSGWSDDWRSRSRGSRVSSSIHPFIHPSTHPSSAFTLIELLVVIAVIGILAALLMPAVLSALKSATSVHCKSNLRQVTAGFMLYTKHYGGWMPPSGSPSGNPPRRYPMWCKNLTPFVTDDGIFTCPAKKRADYGYGLNHMWIGPDVIYSGQAMNDRSREIEEVRGPSGTVIICDTGYTRNKDQWPDWDGETDASNTNGCCRFPYDNTPDHQGDFYPWYNDPRRPVQRHEAKTNCLFFDGHVEGIETADIVDDLWDEPGCIYDNDGHPKRKL